MKSESFNSVTGKLQRDIMSLSDVRDLFNAVMKEFSETNNLLCMNRSVILCPFF